MLQGIYARLKEIKRHHSDMRAKDQNKRVIYMIQDLLDLRANNWQQKVLKEGAKTLKEVHRDAVNE